jgi:hypothetical protein
VGHKHAEFWRQHPGLVWSNPEADDDVLIGAALLRPRFLEILEIAAEFGLERVEARWRELSQEDTPESRRAAPVVQRILKNLRRGRDNAAAGD